VKPILFFKASFWLFCKWYNFFYFCLLHYSSWCWGVL